MTEIGQFQPFGAVAKISGERPLAQARRRSDDGGSTAAAPARRAVEQSPAASATAGRSRPNRAWCSRRAGARVRAAGPGRMAGGRSNAAAARAPRGQRPRSREAADRAAFATPRRNWLRVTNDNGLRADVILALDRLTHRYSPALRAEAGAAPASYPILCTNLAEEDRQTKEES